VSTGLDVLNDLKVDRTPALHAGFNPYYHSVARDGSGLLVDGIPFIDCASNDYLGLATDPRIARAVGDAVERFGASLCGTPIASGYAQIFQHLERDLANFCGLESAVLFPSCYQANCALFSAIVDSKDVVLVDHYAHASLIHGIRASGCKMKPFLHNDMAHLERLLSSASGYRAVLVVTESVFSTEGTVAPLDRIVELCRRYGAVPVVDDSHGLGVVGRKGSGILEEKNIADFEGICTASLGKALANAGGMIAGPARLIDYLRYSCPGLIYSTALPPSSVGGLIAALDIVREEFPVRRARLYSNRNRIATVLRDRGFTVAGGDSPIISVLCGSAKATFSLARRLHEKGIFSTPFIPPSVPEGKGCIRLIPNAGLSEGAVDQIVASISSLQGGCCL
jgi:8-amino-7-oxononanoate synthase